MAVESLASSFPGIQTLVDIPQPSWHKVGCGFLKSLEDEENKKNVFELMFTIEGEVQAFFAVSAVITATNIRKARIAELNRQKSKKDIRISAYNLDVIAPSPKAHSHANAKNSIVDPNVRFKHLKNPDERKKEETKKDITRKEDTAQLIELKNEIYAKCEKTEKQLIVKMNDTSVNNSKILALENQKDKMKADIDEIRNVINNERWGEMNIEKIEIKTDKFESQLKTAEGERYHMDKKIKGLAYEVDILKAIKDIKEKYPYFGSHSVIINQLKNENDELKEKVRKLEMEGQNKDLKIQEYNKRECPGEEEVNTREGKRARNAPK